jgi:hypothetical protein
MTQPTERPKTTFRDVLHHLVSGHPFHNENDVNDAHAAVDAQFPEPTDETDESAEDTKMGASDNKETK